MSILKRVLTFHSIMALLFVLAVWLPGGQASQLIINPKFLCWDDNGDPVGCCIYTYTTGTNTPLGTYSDKALTTLRTNPIQADARGEAGPIYGSGIYRIRVGNPSDDGTCPASVSDQEWMMDGVEGVGSSILDFTLLSDYANFATAVSTIGATETELWIDEDVTLTQAETIPATLKLRQIPGNSITLGAFNLTLNGDFEPVGLFFEVTGVGNLDINGYFPDVTFQFISETSTGTTSMKDAPIKHTRPEWWGGDPEDSTGDATEFQAAFDAWGAEPHSILLRPTDYSIGYGLVSASGTGYLIETEVKNQYPQFSMTCEGKAQCYVKATGTGFMFDLNEDAAADKTNNLAHMRIAGILFDGGELDVSAFRAFDVKQVTFEDCRFMHFHADEGAIYLAHRDHVWFERCSFYDNKISVHVPAWLQEWSQTWGFNECAFSGDDEYSIYILAPTADTWITHSAFSYNATDETATNAIYVVTGTGAAQAKNAVSYNFTVKDSTFEAAQTQAMTYIHVDNLNGKSMTQAHFIDNSFFGGNDSGIALEKTSGGSIVGNMFISNATNNATPWSLDSDCTRILIGHNRYSPSDAGAPVNSMDDENDLRTMPQIIMFDSPYRCDNDNGGGTDYWGTSLAGGDAITEVTIDVDKDCDFDGTNGPAIKGLVGAWLVNLMIRDSDSEDCNPGGAGVGDCHAMVFDTADSTNEAVWVNVAGMLDDTWAGHRIWIRPGANNDFELRYNSTGDGTMEIYLSILGCQNCIIYPEDDLSNVWLLP